MAQFFLLKKYIFIASSVLTAKLQKVALLQFLEQLPDRAS